MKWILIALTVVNYSLAMEGERSDSGIFGPRYAEILKDMERIESEHPDLVRLVDYGKSVRGKTLRMMIVQNSKVPALNHPALLMTGSTHGNEYLNIEDRLPEALIQLSRKGTGPVADFINEGGAFVFVPILNPDGYDSRSRYNAHGTDLNRDWDVKPANHKGFKEVETRVLANHLK